MKKNYLYDLVKDAKSDILNHFEILKNQYPNILNFNSFNELLERIKSKELLDAIKKLISNFSFDENIKNILLNRLDDTEDRDPIVIGITGTVGKTSIAYLLSEYFKAYGKKVTLLSSAEIDNPILSISKNFPIDVPIMSLDFLKYFIKESLNYNSDIIIVEVSEEAIKDGRVDGIPFDIKVLSHFWSNWVLPDTSEETYFQNKSKFFEKEDDVMYFINNNAQMVHRFIEKTKNYKLFGARVNSQNIKNEDTNYITENFFQNIRNQTCIIRGEKGSYTLKSKNMFGIHYAINLTCIVGILEYLDMLNTNILTQVLCSTKVPGREVITAGGRTFIVTLNYLNEINFIREFLAKDYVKENAIGEAMLGEKFNCDDINNIVLLDGIEGYSPNWKTRNGKTLTEEVFRSMKEERAERDNMRWKSLGFEGLSKIYLTPNNPGHADPEEVIEYLREMYEPSQKPITTISDRRLALQTVVAESQPGDLIFISGRGNFQYYELKDETLFFTDSEIITDMIKNLSWGKDLS